MSALTPQEWQDILDAIEKNDPNLVRKWFSELRCGELHHGVLTVLAQNIPQQRYLSEHAASAFTAAAQAVTGRLISVRFQETQGPAEPRAGLDLDDNVPLNAEYVFDQFVVGPANRLAHAASVAVSENPGQTYNPLFLHGSVGLGKTHLMQAICHRALETQPECRILYLTCETFMNHFVEAVERGSLERFRYRYRHADILLIDDIQFLAERERSQEEFFHTFNTLFQVGKQIVLSADCPPREIPSLEERLVSRFSWGLVTRIDKPCMETRMAIVRKKARIRRIELPEDVVVLLSSRIDSNTRELEGAITTLDAISQQLGRTIDRDTALEALGEVRRRPPVAIPQILELVTQRFDVTKAELLGPRRTKSIAFPRQICMHLARDLTDHSLEEIGNYFGGRDHTTAMHAVRLVERRAQEDDRLSATLADLKSRLCERTAV